ncbi:hypothetical protein VNI00_010913 [Paramarasmius palmivorus]|uniref:DUF6534 domain-containing protein n=1 Tax=Paramarasmius palmivorus TaxID=297713 RepID=A0AAW0CFU5_9AGAR
MDFAVTIFNNMFVHYFAITHFGNVSKLMPYIERNSFITLELLLGVTVVFMSVFIHVLHPSISLTHANVFAHRVELFFASHVYLLKRTHWSVPFFIALCALAAYGGSLSALSDIVVTGALLWSFQQSKTGFRKTDSMLQTLFKYTVTRGALVTVFQIVYVAVFLARTDKLEWPAFQLMLSKIYVITMLAMLNSRKSIRANNSGVLTISEIGASLGDSRAIHDNFIVPMDITEERPNGSYQLKEYPQGNPV